jgi:uncharacterized membrane protein
MDDPTERETPLEAVAVGAAMTLGFGIAGTLYALGVDAWWIGFPMIGGLVPLAVGLAKQYERTRSTRAEAGSDDGEETADALEQLRERYARDEIGEAEFERRLERLLETESVADARDALDRRRDGEARADPDTPGTATGTDAERDPLTERE